MNILDKNLKKRVLKEITPNKDEIKELDLLVDVFKTKLLNSARELNYSINIELGGSYAKNTFLRGDFDIDFFIQFHSNIDDIQKEEILIEILTYSEIDFDIKHGSRVYVSGFFTNSSNTDSGEIKNNFSVSGFNFECVPTEICSDINIAKNSTDISIFHVKYLKDKVDKDSILVDEIRLAKRWFKIKKLYGAESYINGFSGHSIECLIMKFKTFENLILFMSSMDKNQILVIDDNNLVKNSFSKDKYSPLMMHDPIHEGRNTLSALNEELFYKAKYYAIQHTLLGFEEKDFLDNNSKKYTLQELDNLFFNESLPNLGIRYTFKKTQLSKDILGSKLLKLTKKISKLLTKYGFLVQDIHFEIHEAEYCAFAKIIIENSKLPKKYLSKSISLDVLKSHLIKFLQVHRNSKLRVIQNFIYVEKKREFSSLKEFSEMYLSDMNNLRKEIDITEFDFLDKILFNS